MKPSSLPSSLTGMAGLLRRRPVVAFGAPHHSRPKHTEAKEFAARNPLESATTSTLDIKRSEKADPSSPGPSSYPGISAHKKSRQQIPRPIPLVPDVQTFLKVIGRGLSAHAKKFNNWKDLFSSNNESLIRKGIVEASSRRYLMHWLERYREGHLGPGADFTHVVDGVAHLRTLKMFSVKDGQPRTMVHVYNLPPDVHPSQLRLEDLVRPRGYAATASQTITGPYTQPAQGKGRARVVVAEGMWEVARGHKIDGGERRRAEVRFLRGVAERKAQREQAGGGR